MKNNLTLLYPMILFIGLLFNSKNSFSNVSPYWNNPEKLADDIIKEAKKSALGHFSDHKLAIQIEAMLINMEVVKDTQHLHEIVTRTPKYFLVLAEQEDIDNRNRGACINLFKYDASEKIKNGNIVILVDKFAIKYCPDLTGMACLFLNEASIAFGKDSLNSERVNNDCGASRFPFPSVKIDNSDICYVKPPEEPFFTLFNMLCLMILCCAAIVIVKFVL